MAIEYQSLRLMHLHGDERFPMHERGHHDAVDRDPERGWVSGATIFKCTRCDEEIVVMRPGNRVSDEDPV